MQDISQGKRSASGQDRAWSACVVPIIALALLVWWMPLGTAAANPTLDPSASNSEIEAALAGPGIAVTPNSLSVITGQASQFGTFTGGDVPAGPGPVVGIDRGIFLVTGDSAASGVPDFWGGAGGARRAVSGPNDAGGISSELFTTFADAQLQSLDANAVFDPVVLQLQVTPSASFLKFSFVFGSEEYPEYVCTIFNDAFGFFIKPVGSSTWQNVALVPGTPNPVAVNTLNGGSCGVAFHPVRDAAVTRDLSQSNLYVNNGDGSTPANNANLQYDGFSIPFVVDAAVTPGQTYDVKLAIADAGDGAWDSAVFLKWISASNYTNDADLQLSLTADNTSPVSGSDTVTFTLDIANTGQDPVAGTQVAFDLPSGFTWVSDTSGGNYNPSNGIWSVPGALAAAGGTSSIDIVATAGGAAGAIDAWAQVTTMNANDVDSVPGNGALPTVAEDDEAAVALNVIALDRSDAPVGGTSYGEALHDIVSGLQLGAAIDADGAPIGNADATGDGADDDGVTFPLLTQGQAATIPVSVTQAGANDGYLQAWIDWNGDGDFADAGEQIATDLQSATAGASTINVPVTVPSGATTNQTFARFRWSTTQGLDATTAAPDGEVEDYALTIEAAGIDLTGTVFFDTGAGPGATAHNGLIEGDETGTGGVMVQLVNTGTGEVIEATETDGAGGYGFVVPATLAGTDVAVRIVPPADARNISSAVTNMTDTSTLDGEATATLAPGTAYTADFGLARLPRLTEDQSRTVASGGSVLLAHTFAVGAPVDVSIALANETVAPAGSFNTALFYDEDCSGTIDAGDAVVSGPRSFGAGEQVCLLVGASSVAAAPSGASLLVDIAVSGTYAGTAVPVSLANTDRVTVSADGALVLEKSVCNATSSTCDLVSGAGFGRNNTGLPGDTLVYRIVFSAPGPDPVDAVEVFDRTPAYSALTAIAPGVVTQPAGLTCALVAPATPAAGYTGELKWSCPGTMIAGEEGVVSFEVEVAR